MARFDVQVEYDSAVLVSLISIQITPRDWMLPALNHPLGAFQRAQER